MSLFLRTSSFLPLPNLIYPSKPQLNPQTQKFLCFSTKNNPQKPNKITDADLSADLSAEIYKLNTQLEERETAMKRSKQLLFSDFCNYLNLNPDEVENQWKKMNPDEKLGLIKGFVSDWGLNFHPLSSKSVRVLIDEFVMKDLQERKSSDLCEDEDDDNSSSSSSSNSDVFFPTLKKLIMGFTPNN